jgi:hypothetical protein
VGDLIDLGMSDVIHELLLKVHGIFILVSTAIVAESYLIVDMQKARCCTQTKETIYSISENKLPPQLGAKLVGNRVSIGLVLSSHRL